MQIDFHYCAVKYLALNAGFDPDEAELLAYASQYVDDATEHKPIRVMEFPSKVLELQNGDDRSFRDGKFDPISTAHKRLQHIAGIVSAVRRKVYIPFHFVPPQPKGGGNFAWRVLADGPLPRQLVDDAIDSFRRATEEIPRARALIRLGIALHAYADSWSHHRFSGRNRESDNGLRAAAGWHRGPWEYAPEWALQMPPIGHVHAHKLPDRSDLYTYLVWKSGEELQRQNAEWCLSASRSIYAALCRARGTSPRWRRLYWELRPLFLLNESDAAVKAMEWAAWGARQSPAYSFGYDPESWRRWALKGDRVSWDEFNTKEEFAALDFKAGTAEETKNLYWFLFHIEARRQRKFVAERIPGGA